MSSIIKKIEEILEDEDSLESFLKDAKKSKKVLKKALEQLQRSKDEEAILLKQSKDETYRTRQFVHILCHDIVNPLYTTKTLMTRFRSSKPGKWEEIIKKIDRCLDKTTDMIDEVRILLAVEEGKLKFELKFSNLQHLLETSLEILNPRIEQKKIQIVKEIEPGLEILVESATFINSVFNNLLTNAIKFSPEGSKIIIKAEKVKQNVHVVIQDFGIGMPKKILNNIYDPSKSTSRAGTNGEQGTGFGMPLVKRFMESYEGAIKIESIDRREDPENCGTTVYLDFWAQAKKAAA